MADWNHKKFDVDVDWAELHEKWSKTDGDVVRNVVIGKFAEDYEEAEENPSIEVYVERIDVSEGSPTAKAWHHPDYDMPARPYNATINPTAPIYDRDGYSEEYDDEEEARRRAQEFRDNPDYFVEKRPS